MADLESIAEGANMTKTHCTKLTKKWNKNNKKNINKNFSLETYIYIKCL